MTVTKGDVCRNLLNEMYTSLLHANQMKHPIAYAIAHEKLERYFAYIEEMVNSNAKAK